MKQYLPFRFQQFEVQQQKSAMKVGTDGVLLGAWCTPPDKGNVLDIGTGTGLISLILAQRFAKLNITAIDIDSGAIAESAVNFRNSPWNERLQVIGCPLQEFSSKTFNFIVSNPPFFPKEKNFNPKDSARKRARMDVDLNFEALFSNCNRLLKNTGKLALILPYSEWNECQKLACENHLFPEFITFVKGTISSPVKRVLIQFCKEQVQTESNELIIEEKRHHYSDEFLKLTDGLYL